jgi:hypothetical protein
MILGFFRVIVWGIQFALFNFGHLLANLLWRKRADWDWWSWDAFYHHKQDELHKT